MIAVLTPCFFMQSLCTRCALARENASSETQGQLVEAGKSLTGRGKNRAKKSVLDFSSPDFFPRPFRLFPAPTNCPWVSEDGENCVQPPRQRRGSLGTTTCDDKLYVGHNEKTWLLGSVVFMLLWEP